MKRKIRLMFPALVVTLALCLAGCGGAATDNATTESYSSAPSEPQAGYSEDSASTYGGMGENGVFEPIVQGRKVIYTTSMHIETKTFDDSHAAILAAVKEAGGYVSASERWGGFSGYDDSYSARSAYLTLKIPAENYAAFLAKGEAFGNITNVNESTQDVTTAYIDTQSRLSSLRAQEAQLLELMKKAETVEEVIAVQDMLTDVVYEIESLTSTLNTYDHLVAYCTVEISLREVTTITVQRTSFGGRLFAALKDSLRSLLSIGEGLATGLVFLLPYVIIGLALFFPLRAALRRRRAKRAAALLPENTPPEA